jgi:hypothetical protein
MFIGLLQQGITIPGQPIIPTFMFNCYYSFTRKLGIIDYILPDYCLVLVGISGINFIKDCEDMAFFFRE